MVGRSQTGHLMAPSLGFFHEKKIQNKLFVRALKKVQGLM